MPTDERDIRQLWAALANREARLLALLKASAQIVWVTDASGHVLSDVNPPAELADLTWSNFTGLDQRSLSGSGWIVAVHPADQANVAALGKKGWETGENIEGEFRVRHKSGEWRWMICRGQPLRAADGKISGWMGTCTDVTNAKQMEEAYREARHRLLAAIDAGEMSTWIWNAQDAAFLWDEAGDKLWGLADGRRGHSLEELIELIHPDDRAAVTRAAEVSVSSRVAQSVEFRTLRPDGAVQWLQSRGRMEVDEQGRAVRATGAFIDITKLKVAEESLRQAQKLQALGTLAGGIAHDFNNIVLAIAGNAQLALNELDARHPARRSLQEISKASTRAGDLVQRVLTFAASRPSAASVTPLRSAIEEGLALLRSSVPDNVRLITRFSSVDLSCTLPQAELEQIIVNLVNNAIHAIGIAPGEIEIVVDEAAPVDRPTTFADERGYARIVIRDSGSGMSESTRARVFEPFFTTKPQGQGTGLGLAVVHGVVRAAGGGIDVASEEGRGTTFTLWLPRATSVAGEQPASPNLPRFPGQGEHILYVDDDEAITFLVQRILEKSGYRVTCCDDPRDAYRAFVEQPHAFDVVVTDLTMPTMGGFELVRGLRAIRSDVPVIMMSGYVRDSDQTRANDEGIGRILLKPNTIEELGHELNLRCAQLRAARQVGP